jgi:hypothetical protein
LYEFLNLIFFQLKCIFKTILLLYIEKKMFLKGFFLVFVFVLSIFDISSSTVIQERRRFRRSPVGPVWPSKKIPYAFSNILEFDFEARVIIERAIKKFEISLAIDGEPCLDFTPRKNEKDYILFVDNGDCSSGIGFYSGVNRISLSKYCYQEGTIMHELMHRLG